MNYNKTLKKVIDFHGHLCPGLAYGYRVGEAALKAFGNRADDEEIVAIVENDSCSVDAIQVMTGCTFGKGNLIFKDTGKQVYTLFKRKTGEGIRISVDFTHPESPEDKAVWQRFLAGDKSEEVSSQIRKLKTQKVEEILLADEAEILKIRHVDVPPPPKARLYPTVRCEKCGEKVMSSRIQGQEGRQLCIPCSNPTLETP